MKKFHFTAEKLLKWRRIEVRLAESAYEQALRAVQQAERKLTESFQEETALASFLSEQTPLTAIDLSLVAPARNAFAGQRRKLDDAVAAARRHVDATASIVTTGKTRVKVLERLRDDRQRTWMNAADKELALATEESHRAMRLRNERS